MIRRLRTSHANRSLRNRHCRFETLEGRRLLVAEAIALSPSLTAAFERVSDFDNYSADEIKSAEQWILHTRLEAHALAAELEIDDRALLPIDLIPGVFALNRNLVDSGLDTSTLQDRIRGSEQINFSYPLVKRARTTRTIPNDPLFSQQWNLNNDQHPDIDPQLVEVWDDYRGKGVVIGIVDEGVQADHPDLTDNYLAEFSYDFVDADADPSPGSMQASHGTSVAGVAAAKGGNQIGISGAAPDASLAAIRLPLTLTQTDLTESQGIRFGNQQIDVYNHSWGPSDNGVADGPGPLFIAAMERSVQEGRGGLGNIHVWAAGNGGQLRDSVNLDGYANLRYTIATTAIDFQGQRPFYAEPGASILISAISSNEDQRVVSTDLVGEAGSNRNDDRDRLADPNYTSTFGGTSAASPLVAGVVALMLEANPQLTYRDVQHILVETAIKNDPDDADWITNAAGYDVNQYYGFGAVDAKAAVDLAKSWKSVGSEKSTFRTVRVNRELEQGGTLTSTLDMPQILTVDWIEVNVNIQHERRGDLEITLTSPSGTESVLVSPRTSDSGGYDNWVFSTARNWGETSYGTWTLAVRDLVTDEVGILENWSLNIYGTKRLTLDPVVPETPDPADDPEELGGGDDVPDNGDSDGGDPDPPATDDPDGSEPVASGSISGSVMQSDGVHQGVAGISVFLDLNLDGRIGIAEPRIKTDNLGQFRFDEIPSGNYEVRINPTAGWAVDANRTRGVLVRSGEQRLTFTVRSNLDFGDAPFPFPTSLADGGAVHAIESSLYLGNRVDRDAIGMGNSAANFDDISTNDDEDGIAFQTDIVPGVASELMATASRSAHLQGWIDFNADGDWMDDGEQIFTNMKIGAGENRLLFLVPDAALPGVTYARFRLADQINVSYTGRAITGEVEDYVVLIGTDTSDIREPIARNDQLTVLENSESNLLHVLSNDTLPFSGARITSVSAGSIRGGLIIGAGGGSLEYTPATDFVGVEEFSYTLENLAGQTSQATIMVTVQGVVIPPIANDDAFTVLTNSPHQELSVLNNDSLSNGTLSIHSIETQGTVGDVSISEDGKLILYQPQPGYSGPDAFHYTVIDANELTDSAVVNVDVSPVYQTVRIELMAVNAEGTLITNIRPHAEFELHGYVTDTRSNPRGVFAAYLDVEYDPTLATVDGEITHGADYRNAQSGETQVSGLMNEVGGTDGIRPLGREPRLLFKVPMKAVGSGTLDLDANPADLLPEHHVLHFGANTFVPEDEIQYLGTQLFVSEFTNPNDPLDTNGDGVLSPFDALLIVNNLNLLGGRELASDLPLSHVPRDFVDVNGDGFLTPIDALTVINELNSIVRSKRQEESNKFAIAASLDDSSDLEEDDARPDPSDVLMIQEKAFQPEIIDQVITKSIWEENSGLEIGADDPETTP